jgi:hypothetical protein
VVERLGAADDAWAILMPELTALRGETAGCPVEDVDGSGLAGANVFAANADGKVGSAAVPEVGRGERSAEVFELAQCVRDPGRSLRPELIAGS